MKIKDFINSLEKDYDFKLKIIKKWIFWILINEDAFFFSNFFHLKITILDKQTIKVWFPDGSKQKWLSILKQNNLAYTLYEKEDWVYKEIWKNLWIRYTDIFKFDLEDYNLTKERILWLNKVWFEEKNEKNFLLKDKLEDIYIIVIDLLLRLPKKQRYFFREKLERLFFDLFENVYKYMYNIWDRKDLIEKIFSSCMVLREFFRFLYKIWKIKNDNVYLDLWDRWIEILKICKSIKEKS